MQHCLVPLLLCLPMVHLIANGWDLPDSSDSDISDHATEHPTNGRTHRRPGIFGCREARLLRDNILLSQNMMPPQNTPPMAHHETENHMRLNPMKKETFLRVLAIMKKLRVEYARLHPLAFWNYYRDFNVRWMFRDVRRVIVMAYHACQPQAASQPQVAALASKPQAASLGCLQDEEEAEWKKRRRERRKRRRTLSNHRSGASEMRRRIWAYGQRVVLRTHHGTWTNLDPRVIVLAYHYYYYACQPQSSISRQQSSTVVY